MKELNQSVILLDCPKCYYGMDVDVVSVILQRLVFCPCCKSSIQLIDSEASLYGAQAKIESEIGNLQREFKKFEKTFQFEI